MTSGHSQQLEAPHRATLRSAGNTIQAIPPHVRYFAETREDQHTNDTQTAADMNTFLRHWFSKFSEFRVRCLHCCSSCGSAGIAALPTPLRACSGQTADTPNLLIVPVQDNDFFISGESFAGVYVPLISQVGAASLAVPACTHACFAKACVFWAASSCSMTSPLLPQGPHRHACMPHPTALLLYSPRTQAVLDGNDAGQEPRLNLRGYLVGNGVTDPRFDGDALVPFAYGKSLIRCGAGAGRHGAPGWRTL